MRDANEYYLQHHLEETERLMARADRIDEMALELVQDKTSEWWPWSADRVQEAFCEADERVITKLVRAHDNDFELSETVRDIVELYWLNQAAKHLEKNLDH